MTNKWLVISQIGQSSPIPNENQHLCPLWSYFHHLLPLIVQAFMWGEWNPWRSCHVAPLLLHKKATHWLAELEDCTAVRSLRKGPKKGTLTTYFEVMNYLSETYATEEIAITQTDTRTMRFTKAQDKTLIKYPELNYFRHKTSIVIE